MSHDYHEGLPGYDPRQLLHDGCEECEERSRDLSIAITRLDPERFAHAWRRAYDQYATRGGGYEATGPISSAESPLLAALWGIQIQLERRGVPLTGEPPQASDLAATPLWLGAR